MNQDLVYDKDWDRFHIQVVRDLEAFVNSDRAEHPFPVYLNFDQRKEIHILASKVGLRHYSTGEGEERFITVVKPRHFNLSRFHDYMDRNGIPENPIAKPKHVQNDHSDHSRSPPHSTRNPPHHNNSDFGSSRNSRTSHSENQDYNSHDDRSHNRNQDHYRNVRSHHKNLDHYQDHRPHNKNQDHYKGERLHFQDDNKNQDHYKDDRLHFQEIIHTTKTGITIKMTGHSTRNTRTSYMTDITSHPQPPLLKASTIIQISSIRNMLLSTPTTKTGFGAIEFRANHRISAQKIRFNLTGTLHHKKYIALILQKRTKIDRKIQLQKRGHQM